jgi:hypothetical protein
MTVRELQQRVRRLHAREEAGVSGETPFLALAGVWLFLLPLFLFLLLVAYGAYYLAS